MKKPRWTLRIVQASPTTFEVDEPVYTIANEYPAPFKLTAQLTFAMLSQKMSHCGSGRMPSLSWILALTLLIMSEHLTLRVIVLPTIGMATSSVHTQDI